MKKIIVLTLIIAASILLLRQQPSQAQTTTWQYVYLPMVEKGEGVVVPTETPIPTETAVPIPTATNTATASPTPTAPSCNGLHQALQNPSFETGWYPWVSTGLAARSSYFASVGSWSVLLGGYNNAGDSVGQLATVPNWAESAAAYFDEMLFSYDSQTTRYDVLGIKVVDLETTTPLAWVTLDNTGVRDNWIRWKLPINNIASWRGRTIDLMFLVTTDSSFISNWHIDNVALVFGCGTFPAGPEADTQEAN